MKLTSLHELFVDQLKDIYSAEEQLIDALPTVIDVVQDRQLKEGLERHLEATRAHLQRLNEVFQSIQTEPQSKFCEGMKGLIEECEECVECDAEPAVKDQALIACAQRCEHYEIAVYGTLCAYAERMGHEEAGRLLQETLTEEKATDEELTEVAERLETPLGMGMGTQAGGGTGRRSGLERERGAEQAQGGEHSRRARGSQAASEPGGRRGRGARRETLPEGSRRRRGVSGSEESDG